MFRPFRRLITIVINDAAYAVPESNTLLRALQYLAPEGISYGRFCWNEECQYCRVQYDLGPGTAVRAALACKLMAEPGLRIREMSPEIRYCLRELGQSSVATPR